MEFHSDVLEAKQYLQDFYDPRLNIMDKLTLPPRGYVKEYEKMWKDIHDISAAKNDNWVLSFLDSVISAVELPPHSYINGQHRKDLREKIRLHAGQLINLCVIYGLDMHVSNAPGGSLVCEDLKNFAHGDLDRKMRNKRSFTKILEVFAERSDEALKKSTLKGKADKNVKVKKFIRILGAYNKQTYKKPLNSVLRTAAFAIYQVDYPASDIVNLLNR